MEGKTVSFDYDQFNRITDKLDSIIVQDSRRQFVLIGFNENEYMKTFDPVLYNQSRHLILNWESDHKKIESCKDGGVDYVVQSVINEPIMSLSQGYISVFEFVLIILLCEAEHTVLQPLAISLPLVMDFEYWEGMADFLVFCDINHELCTLIEFNKPSASTNELKGIFHKP